MADCDGGPVQEAAEALLAAGLAAMAPNGAPAFSAVTYGDDPAWDQCCSGAVYVRMVRVFGYDTFPNAGDSTKCPAGVAAELEVVALRCANNPNRRGKAGSVRGGGTGTVLPSAAEVDGVARVMNADAFNLLAEVTRLACQWRDEHRLVATTQVVPVGPQGGCVGTAMTVIVKLPAGAGICP